MSEVVHYQTNPPGTAPDRFACGEETRQKDRANPIRASRDKTRVTCGSCKKNRLHFPEVNRGR